MRRYAGKEGEYQQESYAKFMKRKTKGIFFYTRIVKVVLKKASMSGTYYNYILAKRTRGKFYLQSIGFP